ncbi:ferrochelatase [Gilvimarinus sp. F26214L]|uniref:ferrochelatase n=1 Tax=Gilvimarinus sp. DZF01 TaxID=3461371 RepID=UPI00404543E0
MHKWAVILMNLGTPAAPTKKAYRAFLKEFLSDPRVVEIPRPLWWPILNLFILPFRPAKVASAYQQIWDPQEGAPLAAITQRQVEALSRELKAQLGESAPLVTFAMTYGAPKLEERIGEMQAAGAEKILVLPLYPQYSATTTASIYDQFAALVSRSRDVPDVTINKFYFDDPGYTAALAESVREFRRQNGSGERLLMSFHGIPQRNVDLGDPYDIHCRETAGALSEALGLDSDKWGLSFQSRLGKATWLQPYTVDVLKRWAAEGIKVIDVVCPAFAADCLETLEEIAVEGRAIFRAAGGEELRLIPCLNDRESHIELLANIVRKRTGLTGTGHT